MNRFTQMYASNQSNVLLFQSDENWIAVSFNFQQHKYASRPKFRKDKCCGV